MKSKIFFICCFILLCGCSKKEELFTDYYKVEGNSLVDQEKTNLDYENNKENNNLYIVYTISNNTITKITLS